jgi:hypothetical protein
MESDYDGRRVAPQTVIVVQLDHPILTTAPISLLFRDTLRNHFGTGSGV